jgi:hypothetical protein
LSGDLSDVDHIAQMSRPTDMERNLSGAVRRVPH